MRKLLGLTVFALVFYALALSVNTIVERYRYPLPPRSRPVMKPGMPAAQFTLKDLDGKTVSMMDFKGQNVFLYIWADWCGACKAHLPELEKMHKDTEFPAKVITIAVEKNAHKIRARMKRGGYTFPVLMDRHNLSTEAFSVMAFPTLVLVDTDGRIVFNHSGIEGDMRSEVVAALAHPRSYAAGTDLHRKEGYELERQKKYLEAVREYEKATIKDPSDIESWHRMGHSAMKMGDDKTALMAFQHVVELDPKHACGKHMLYHIHEDMGEYRKALDFCIEAREMDPGEKCLRDCEKRLRAMIAAGDRDAKTTGGDWWKHDEELLCSTGRSLLEAGNADDAIKYLEMAYDIEPAGCGASLVHAYTAAGNHRKARLILERLSELDGDGGKLVGRARYHYELGLIYEAKGDLKDARGQYIRSLGYNPGYTESKMGLERLDKTDDGSDRGN